MTPWTLRNIVDKYLSIRIPICQIGKNHETTECFPDFAGHFRDIPSIVPYAVFLQGIRGRFIACSRPNFGTHECCTARFDNHGDYDESD